MTKLQVKERPKLWTSNSQIVCESAQTRLHIKSPPCLFIKKSVLSLARPIFLTGAIIQTRFQASLLAPPGSIECARIWEAEWGGKVFFSHGTTHSKGVMTLINPTLDFKVEKSISDKNGRFLILDVAFDDTHFILANIYAPNDAKQQIVFFKDLQKHLGEFTQENMIIVGDFNCALTNRDKKVETQFQEKPS